MDTFSLSIIWIQFFSFPVWQKVEREKNIAQSQISSLILFFLAVTDAKRKILGVTFETKKIPCRSPKWRSVFFLTRWNIVLFKKCATSFVCHLDGKRSNWNTKWTRLPSSLSLVNNSEWNRWGEGGGEGVGTYNSSQRHLQTEARLKSCCRRFRETWFLGTFVQLRLTPKSRMCRVRENERMREWENENRLFFSKRVFPVLFFHRDQIIPAKWWPLFFFWGASVFFVAFSLVDLFFFDKNHWSFFLHVHSVALGMPRGKKRECGSKNENMKIPCPSFERMQKTKQNAIHPFSFPILTKNSSAHK